MERALRIGDRVMIASNIRWDDIRGKPGTIVFRLGNALVIELDGGRKVLVSSDWTRPA